MPPRKAAKPPNANKNNGKSSNGKYSDEHPDLQTNYRKFQVLTYDSAVAIERNDIDLKLQSLQTDLSDGKAIQNSFKCIYLAIS